jgi:hypothetical protein
VLFPFTIYAAILHIFAFTLFLSNISQFSPPYPSIHLARLFLCFLLFFFPSIPNSHWEALSGRILLSIRVLATAGHWTFQQASKQQSHKREAKPKPQSHSHHFHSIPIPIGFYAASVRCFPGATRGRLLFSHFSIWRRQHHFMANFALFAFHISAALN